MKKLSILLYFNQEELSNFQDRIDLLDVDLTKKCLDSILTDGGLAQEDLEVLLLNVPSEGAAAKAAKQAVKKYPNSVKLLSLDVAEEYRTNPTYFWQTAVKEAQGEYVSFMLTTSCFGKGALGVLKSEERKADALISLRPEYTAPDIQTPVYRVSPVEGGPKDIFKNILDGQVCLPAFLIRKDLLEGMEFKPEMEKEALPEFCMRLLVKNGGKYYYDMEHAYYFALPLEDRIGTNGYPQQKWWYLDSINGFARMVEEIKEQNQGVVPEAIQVALYYFICLKCKANLAGNDKLMMDAEEAEQFMDTCYSILTVVDNELIFQQNEEVPRVNVPRALRLAFLQGKAKKMNCKVRQVEEKSHVFLEFINDQGKVMARGKIGDLSDEIVNVRVINYRGGNLEFDGTFNAGAFLLEGTYEFYAQIDGKKPQRMLTERTKVYDIQKCFGLQFGSKYQFHAEVPLEAMLKNGAKLSFYVKCGKSVNRLAFRFTSVNSRLLTYSQKAYWRFDHDKYMLRRTGNSLTVIRSNAWKTLKQELLLDAVLLIQKERWVAFKSVMLRLLYWLTRPYYKKKRIWITFDKLFKAGDNGEYFFQYCQTVKDRGIDCYYLINKDAIDAKRLRKQHPGRILYSNTVKTKLLVLHAEAIMATHAGASTYLGFPGVMHKYFKNLYQSDNVCIQHGLSIQQIASFQNRLYANTRLYCLASPFELDNVAKPEYGYAPEELKLTGLARYDGLKSKEQKQILITPTWRKNVVHTKGVGMTNEHSSTFKQTAYYRIYNSLINDPELIACAKKHGYRIVFLLHPAMSAQMEDYDKNDYVEILQATGDTSYEQLLTESSLMVTDYSGVQFDFAYQRKPILYYHPDELPPHYTEGGLIYSTMGFGPICTNHQQIIDGLCKNIENGCQLEEEYKQRADRFFTFDDFNNAARIFEEVIRFEQEK